MSDATTLPTAAAALDKTIDILRAEMSAFGASLEQAKGTVYQEHCKYQRMVIRAALDALLIQRKRIK